MELSKIEESLNLVRLERIKQVNEPEGLRIIKEIDYTLSKIEDLQDQLEYLSKKLDKAKEK
jgi:hypothetical protein